MSGEGRDGKSPARGSEGSVGIKSEEQIVLLVAEKVEAGGRFTTVDEMLCMKAQFGKQSNERGSDGVKGRIERAQPWLADGELRNAQALRGCIAVVGSGECSFAAKARAVQRAGAIAAVIVDRTNSRNFIHESGAPDVSIPVVLVRRTDGEALHTGVEARIDLSRVDPAFIEAHEEECKAGEVQRATALIQQLVAMDTDTLVSSLSLLNSLASRVRTAFRDPQLATEPRKSTGESVSANLCMHNRQRRECEECRGGRMCEHNRQRNKCKACGGASICEHKKQRHRCKDCGGAGICEHKIQRHRCKDCGGAGICEHNREKAKCKECGGKSICEHNRLRWFCVACGGASMCEHKRQRRRCKDCKPHTRTLLHPPPPSPPPDPPRPSPPPHHPPASQGHCGEDRDPARGTGTPSPSAAVLSAAGPARNQVDKEGERSEGGVLAGDKEAGEGR